MLKLHRLKITRFRSVRPCELVFHDGLNVLLGKNGSGKTTLLRLLADLYSTPLGQIAPGEELDLEVEFKLAAGSVTLQLKRALNRLDDLVLLSPSDVFERYLYIVDIRLEADGYLFQTWKPATEAVFRAELNGELMPGWVMPLESMGLFRLLQFHLQGRDRGVEKRIWAELAAAYPPFRLDESLEALELIRNNRYSFMSRSWPGKKRHVSLAVQDRPYPRGYAERFEELVRDDPDTERIVMDEQMLGFLKRFIELTGLRSARMISERVQRTSIGSEVPTTQHVFSNFHFSFTRRDGSEFPQEQLSYGQKRLLTFLYCQSAIPQVMIADELVNGLHHDWIESCVELLRDRQSFLSSQNPLLLDHLWFESRDEIQETFILCSAEQEEERDVLTWKNMSPEEAEVVHRAYQTGVQHVSEILHSQGLW